MIELMILALVVVTLDAVPQTSAVSADKHNANNHFATI